MANDMLYQEIRTRSQKPGDIRMRAPHLHNKKKTKEITITNGGVRPCRPLLENVFLAVIGRY